MPVNHSPGTENEELTPKQEVLITAMLVPMTIVAAAKVAGIAEKTAHVWLKLPHVQRAYKEAQNTLFTQSLEQLRIGVDEVISKLRKHAVSDEAPHAVQVRAEQIYLEQAINLHKMTELEKRIADLETLLKAKDAK